MKRQRKYKNKLHLLRKKKNLLMQINKRENFVLILISKTINK